MGYSHRVARRQCHLRRGYAVGIAGLVVVAAVVILPGRADPSRVLRRATALWIGSSPGRAVDPSLFTNGSCVSFPPTSGNRHKTVFLDAGHGGLDPGGVGITESGQTIYEANETLPVELDTTALLRAQGFEVVDSRTRNSTVARIKPGDQSGGIFTVQGEHNDVAARDECANRARANILVGIYFDVGASTENAGSITGYDTDRPFSSLNLKLATLVQSDVLSELNAHGWDIPDAGVVSDVYLGGPPLTQAAGHYGHLLLLGPPEAGYFTTPSEMPGALIEPLFITDPFEGTIATGVTGQEAIARGLAQAIEQYFGPPAKTHVRKKTGSG